MQDLEAVIPGHWPGALRARPLLAVAAALVLAACATSAPPEAAAPAVSQTFADLPQSDWPTDQWWSAYGDPQLTRLIEEGLAGSPSLAQAAARLRRAEAQARQAGAARLPSLNANAAIQEVKQSYNTGIPPEFVPQGYNDVARANLDFSWELDFWGRNRAAIAAAASAARAAAADAAEARLILSTSIAAAYADLAALHRDRDVAQRALELRTQTLDLAQQRVDNGLDTQAELNLAKAGPPAARAELKAIDEAIELARHRLAALVGAGPDRALDITPPSEVALRSFGAPQTLVADLVGRRPDVVAARWRAEASGSQVKAARAAFYPNINLAAVVGYQSLFAERLFDSGSDYGAVGPAISLPIFQGGRLKAGLDAAVASHDEAAATYDAAVVQAFRDVADALTSLRALEGRLADSREALDVSEAAYQVTRLRYEGGLANYQAVLLAELQVLAQRRAVADLESNRFRLDIALIRALGGGFETNK